MLTEKENNVRIVLEHGLVPVLHRICEEASPAKYKQWGGNACRQTAVFATVALRNLLPEYQWTAWDGWFDDIVKGRPVQYNHAWVYGVNKAEGKRLLVDMARQHHERLFIEVPANRYPKDHPEYVHMKEIRREPLNIEENMADREYYTEMFGHELYNKIMTEIMEGK